MPSSLSGVTRPQPIHGADQLTDSQTKRAVAFADLFNDLTCEEVQHFTSILHQSRKMTLYTDEEEAKDTAEQGLEDAFITLARDRERLRTVHTLRYYPELTREMYSASQPAATETSEQKQETAPAVEVSSLEDRVRRRALQL